MCLGYRCCCFLGPCDDREASQLYRVRSRVVVSRSRHQHSTKGGVMQELTYGAVDNFSAEVVFSDTCASVPAVDLATWHPSGPSRGFRAPSHDPGIARPRQHASASLPWSPLPPITLFCPPRTSYLIPALLIPTMSGPSTVAPLAAVFQHMARFEAARAVFRATPLPAPELRDKYVESWNAGLYTFELVSTSFLFYIVAFSPRYSNPPTRPWPRRESMPTTRPRSSWSPWKQSTAACPCWTSLRTEASGLRGQSTLLFRLSPFRLVSTWARRRRSGGSRSVSPRHVFQASSQPF